MEPNRWYRDSNMRIISGRWKGRRLKEFDLKHLRPTTDRVKETLFNKLMHAIQGSRVADLFAGTGNLGLESLSRGAAYVIFIEQNSSSLRVLKENVSVLKPDTGSYDIRPFDVFRFLRECETPFDVILADPPFTQKIADKVMLAIASSRSFRQGTLVAIESSSVETIEDVYGPFKLLDRRSFGDKNLSLYESESDLPRQF